MANELTDNELKEKFSSTLQELANCKLHPPLGAEEAIKRTKEFLFLAFEIGKRKDITFQRKEKETIISFLTKTLPIIGYYIGYLVTWFEPALAEKALIARSAVQFLFDIFLSEDQFDSFKETENVDGLEECLENWKYGPIGPLDPSFCQNCQQTAGIPESHDWWPEETWETIDDPVPSPEPTALSKISPAISEEDEEDEPPIIPEKEHVNTERQVNLATLVPRNAIDAAIRISSRNGWSKTEQLGDGASGQVWKYKTPIDGTPFAIGKHLKVPLWNLSTKQKTELNIHINKFIIELNTLHKMSSECSERFVQFVGCYVDIKKLILFTEWMPNGSVKDHIIDKPLDESTALKYTFQSAQGLHFLHNYGKGIVAHRDIKCKNLMLTSKNDVKLAGFGLTVNRSVDNESGYGSSGSTPCGFSNTIIFAAPEVLIGEEPGRRTDIWSLGCTLVEMLTCEPPQNDFWHKHKERAKYLFIERAQPGSAKQLQYIGHQLVPNASPSVQKLLDCLFVRNKERRPEAQDVLDVFAYDTSAPYYKIDKMKLEKLKAQTSEGEKSSIPASTKVQP